MLIDLIFANIHLTDFVVSLLLAGALYAAVYGCMRVANSALYMLKERRYLASEGAAFQGKPSPVSETSDLHAFTIWLMRSARPNLERVFRR